MKNPKSLLQDKQARIYEARDRYNNRAKGRPKQIWIEADKTWRKFF